MDIPQELARREQRLARLEEAKAKIEARAAQDYEQAQFEAKRAERERPKNEGCCPPGAATGATRPRRCAQGPISTHLQPVGSILTRSDDPCVHTDRSSR
jgi:hypothetical protein